jgi:hypothetical protein
MKTTTGWLIPLTLLLALASRGNAQGAGGDLQRFQVPWSDPSRPGLLQIQLVNGGIEVEAYEGQEVLFEVSSESEPDEPNPKAQGMRRIPGASFGVSVVEKDNVMTLDSSSWQSALNVKARVPARSRLKLGTVNDGDISVRGVRGELELANTNGEIEVRGAGAPVVAQTVNGDVTVIIAALPAGGGAEPMAFSSLNGDIDVSLPPQTRASLRFDIGGHGEIYSDFEVALQDRAPEIREERREGFTRIDVERAIWGTINGGGREILLKTFNGDVYLRKSGDGTRR